MTDSKNACALTTNDQSSGSAKSVTRKSSRSPQDPREVLQPLFRRVRAPPAAAISSSEAIRLPEHPHVFGTTILGYLVLERIEPLLGHSEDRVGGIEPHSLPHFLGGSVFWVSQEEAIHVVEVVEHARSHELFGPLVFETFVKRRGSLAQDFERATRTSRRGVSGMDRPFYAGAWGLTRSVLRIPWQSLQSLACSQGAT